MPPGPGGGEAGVCLLPPDGYVLAHREAGAEVLLEPVRNGSPYSWSAIIVRKGSGIKKTEDLEGKTIAWVDPLSAAG